MKKSILFFLVILTVIAVFIFFHVLPFSKKEDALINKPKFLCDNRVVNCSNTSVTGVPKGVCIPGGKCTPS